MSTSITSDLDRMVDQAIRKIYKSFTKFVTREKDQAVPDAPTVPDTLTVGYLRDFLADFPRDYEIAFQLGDKVDSQLLHIETIEPDTLYGIVDFVFEEWDVGA